MHSRARASLLSILLVMLSLATRSYGLSIPSHQHTSTRSHGLRYYSSAPSCSTTTYGTTGAIAGYHPFHKKTGTGRHLPTLKTRLGRSSRLHALINPGDQFGIYAAISVIAGLGLKSEKNVLGKTLSGPVTSMLIAAVLTNLGVFPSEGSIYISSLQQFVVKVATPLLLLGADLRKIFVETGLLLGAFLLGAFSTLLGSTVAFLVFGQSFKGIGPVIGDHWKLASALTAKNIGGGLNFMAVADSLGVSSRAVALGLAVDNIVGLLYFPFLAWLGRNYRVNQISSSSNDGAKYTSSDSGGPKDDGEIAVHNSGSDAESILTVTALGLSLTAIAEWLSRQPILGLPQCPPILLATVLTVSLATAFPRTLQQYRLPETGETIGKVLLYLFFASVGVSSGRLSDLFAAPGTAALFGYALLMYVVHGTTMLVVGRKLLRMDVPDLLLASNANIGNAATAAAFATSMGWKRRILPALLVGTFGNVIATPFSILLGEHLLKYL